MRSQVRRNVRVTGAEESTEDLGIYSELSLVTRIVRAIDKVLSVLGRHQVIVGFAIIIYLMIVTSSKLRSYFADAGTQILVGVLLLVLAFALVGAAARLLNKPRFKRRIARPIFGELGGAPRSVFVCALKGSNELRFVLEHRD